MNKTYIHNSKPVFQAFDDNATIIKVFDEAEVNEIKAIAHAEGYKEGLDDGYEQGHQNAVSEYEENCLKLFSSIDQKIENFISFQEEYNNQMSSHLKDALSVIVRKLFPTYLKQQGQREVLGFIDDILGQLLRKENLIIQVHPSLFEIAKEKVLLKTTHVVIEKNETFSNYECEMTWEEGGASYKLEDVHNRILSIIDDIANKENTIQEGVENYAG